MCRICATSNGEQRVQVFILVVQGLSQKQQQLMWQYFELVDWQGLKLPSPRGGNEIVWTVLNAQSKCEKTGYVLRKNLQYLVKSCLQWNCYQRSARNRVQIQRRNPPSNCQKISRLFLSCCLFCLSYPRDFHRDKYCWERPRIHSWED